MQRVATRRSTNKSATAETMWMHRPEQGLRAERRVEPDINSLMIEGSISCEADNSIHQRAER